MALDDSSLYSILDSATSPTEHAIRSDGRNFGFHAALHYRASRRLRVLFSTSVDLSQLFDTVQFIHTALADAWITCDSIKDKDLEYFYHSVNSYPAQHRLQIRLKALNTDGDTFVMSGSGRRFSGFKNTVSSELAFLLAPQTKRPLVSGKHRRVEIRPNSIMQNEEILSFPALICFRFLVRRFYTLPSQRVMDFFSCHGKQHNFIKTSLFNVSTQECFQKSLKNLHQNRRTHRSS